jgi:hypothetical protein
VAKKKKPRYQMVEMLHNYNRRRIKVWMPYLEEKAAARQARIEEKHLQDTGSGAKEEG